MTNLISKSQRVDGNQQRTGIWELDTPNTQKITTTNATTAFTEDTVVRVTVEGDSHIDIGPSAAAAITDAWFPDDHVEMVFVRSGDKIGVVGGTMYVTPTK